MRNAYRILVGKCPAKCPLGKPKLINMKMDFKEIGWDWLSCLMLVFSISGVYSLSSAG
jgi:hypothetical protein